MTSPLTKPYFQPPTESLLHDAFQTLSSIGSLAASDVEMLLPFVHRRFFKKEQVFLLPEKTNSQMCLVQSGAFRTYFVTGSKEVNYDFTFEGEFLLVSADPDCHGYNRFVEALETSSVLYFSENGLASVSNRSRNWSKLMHDLTQEQNRKLEARLLSMLLLGSRERYLDLLENNPKLFARVPLYHIASYLGIERETISRLRRKIHCI
ncbi:MAG: Crp/Fnr family transcriptional regulator [Cyclobacteriaceae bacterium]|nr:Crp/Fnr family transcriptional regulator [Cyclobacteriaceae bacterium]